MTTIINLTPHPVTICGVTYPPTGPAPRCATTVTPRPSLLVDGAEVPVEQVSLGRVTGLPPRVEDTVYVVSRQVAEAVPQRRDLYIPHQLERDATGAVVGCSALGQVPPPQRPAEDTDEAWLAADGTVWQQAGGTWYGTGRERQPDATAVQASHGRLMLITLPRSPRVLALAVAARACTRLTELVLESDPANRPEIAEVDATVQAAVGAYQSLAGEPACQYCHLPH